LEDIAREVLELRQDIIRQYVRHRQGVYALYRRGEIYYVGLASNLRSRLAHHMKDRHQDSWDRFSVYVTIGDSHIREMESLIIRILKPPGNKQKGKFANSEDLRRRFRRDLIVDNRLKMGDIFGKQHELRNSSRSEVRPPRPSPRPSIAGLVEFIYELKQKGKTLEQVIEAGQNGKYAGLSACWFKDRWSKTPRSVKTYNQPGATMPTQGEILFCPMKDAEARGHRSPDGDRFVVLKGSTAVLQERASSEKWPKWMAIRRKLIADGTLVEKDDLYEFTSSFVFSSPSAAATVIHGGPANGLTAWRSKDGKQLKQLDKQS